MSYPAFPPASIWLASVTSLDQTSNCHLRSPRTPQWTRPLWIPTLMFTLTPVTSLTSLQSHTYGQAIVKIKALVTKTAFFSHSICDFIGDNLCTGNVSDIRLFTPSWFHPLCDVIKPGITTTNHQTQLGVSSILPPVPGSEMYGTHPQRPDNYLQLTTTQKRSTAARCAKWTILWKHSKHLRFVVICNNTEETACEAVQVLLVDILTQKWRQCNKVNY